MEYFRADVKVGLFIFLSLALLVVAAVVIGDLGSWFRSAQQYTVLLPNAQMLNRRAKVTYAGLPVGEVIAIAVQTSETRPPAYPVAVTIKVQPTMVLRKDARVELKTNGFIGDRYLDILPGEGPPVPPGGTVLGTLGGLEGMLAALSGAGGGLGELLGTLRTFLAEATHLTQASDPASLPATLHSMQRTLGSLQQFIAELQPQLVTVTGAFNTMLVHVQQDVATTTGKVGRTLERLDTTVADTGAGLKRLMGELQTSVGALQKTLVTTSAFLDSNKGEVTKALGSVGQLSASIQRHAEETLTRLQQVLSHADAVLLRNDRNLYATIENLRDATEQLKAAAQQVQANPSVLLWGARKTPNTASDEALRMLEDRGRVGRYDKLQ